MQEKMIRVGVFYDGNYFLHVSNYYNYDHPRQRRLSITGLHQFIKQEIASLENSSANLCQIVDAHYFRGRLSAQEAQQRGSVLYWDRVFDDILMSAGVTTHYLPIRIGSGGRREEKGIDVWLALEAYESAIHKQFDVIVLIASDGDFLPLVRKLNTLGTRVMILSWDFEFTNDMGKMMVTRTSQDLLEEATYPVPMHEIIDNRLRRNDPIVHNLFVPGESKRTRDKGTFHPAKPSSSNQVGDEEINGTVGEVLASEVLSLKNGYGFIKYPPNNLFFHYTSVADLDFNDLIIGDKVEFTLDKNEDDQFIATNVQLLEEGGQLEGPPQTAEKELVSDEDADAEE